MASALTHCFVGGIASRIAVPHKGASFSLLSAFCAALPDLDILSVPLGIASSSIWFHRGITHSIPFAFLVGLAVALLRFRTVPRFSRRWWGVVCYFFTVTASHGIIDGFTKSTTGVAFFAPFGDARYLFPFRPIPGVGLTHFFSSFGEGAFLTEFCLLWLPGFLGWYLASRMRVRAAREYELT
jgi:inner membrane protein